MSVGSARPLEDAFRISQVDLIEWMSREFGMDRLDGYQLLTQAGRMRVGNMVDPQYSIVAKLEKRYLGT